MPTGTIDDWALSDLLLDAGEVGRASRVALARVYSGEVHNVSSDEDELKAALLSALSGDYRQAATRLRAVKESPNEVRPFRSAILALLLARDGRTAEAREQANDAFPAFMQKGSHAFAIAFLRSMAWFEYVCGDLPASASALRRVLDLCVQANLPRWYRLVAPSAARVAAMQGDPSSGVRLLRVAILEGAIAPADAVDAAAVAITLGECTRDKKLLEPYANLGCVERAFATGRFREAYTIVNGLASAWRSGLLDLEIQALMSLALRGLADPLEAMEVLVDVTAHGRIEDAIEASALLGSATRSREQRMAGACSRLGYAYVELREDRREDAAEHAAEAARLFKSIGAGAFLDRAMEALLQTSSSSAGGERYRRLTKRQREVLALLRTGHRNKEIARTLGITQNTVERHVSVILDELDLRSRWQLVD